VEFNADPGAQGQECALNRGARKIILCVGGSATVDGGAGILQALGVRFLDARGKILPRLPENLVRLESIDLSALDRRILGCELIIPCDVENPLLGANGAAKVFGPQKGASVADVGKLEAGLKKFAEVIFRQTGDDVTSLKHGGAAGGVAAGLHGLLGARLVNGIGHFLDATDFGAALRRADLVITGEGQIDEQTLRRNADVAASLGVQLFIVDLGWARGIGDWHADPAKFPSGLDALSDYVHSLGMKFGLHFALAQADARLAVAPAGGQEAARTGQGRPRQRHGVRLSAAAATIAPKGAHP